MCDDGIREGEVDRGAVKPRPNIIWVRSSSRSKLFELRARLSTHCRLLQVSMKLCSRCVSTSPWTIRSYGFRLRVTPELLFLFLFFASNISWRLEDSVVGVVVELVVMLVVVVVVVVAAAVLVVAVLVVLGVKADNDFRLASFSLLLLVVGVVVISCLVFAGSDAWAGVALGFEKALNRDDCLNLGIARESLEEVSVRKHTPFPAWAASPIRTKIFESTTFYYTSHRYHV